jgi:hypothetical protein
MDNNFGLSLLNELTNVDHDSDFPDDVAMHHFDSPVELPTDLPTAGMTSKQHETLDAHLCVHSLSRSEFYMQISQIAPDLLGPDAPLRAHTDGGGGGLWQLQLIVVTTYWTIANYLQKNDVLFYELQIPELMIPSVSVFFVFLPNVTNTVTTRRDASIHRACQRQSSRPALWQGNINVPEDIQLPLPSTARTAMCISFVTMLIDHVT